MNKLLTHLRILLRPFLFCFFRIFTNVGKKNKCIQVSYSFYLSEYNINHKISGNRIFEKNLFLRCFDSAKFQKSFFSAEMSTKNI